MPKKAMVTLTEQMLYILMSLRDGPKFGIEMTEIIRKRTNNRIKIGPATLYTLLAKFEEALYIIEVDKDQPGRKRTYALTKRGVKAYVDEIKRLQANVKDARDLEEELAAQEKRKTVPIISSKSERYRNPGQQ